MTIALLQSTLDVVYTVYNEECSTLILYVDLTNAQLFAIFHLFSACSLYEEWTGSELRHLIILKLLGLNQVTLRYDALAIPLLYLRGQLLSLKLLLHILREHDHAMMYKA